MGPDVSAVDKQDWFGSIAMNWRCSWFDVTMAGSLPRTLPGASAAGRTHLYNRGLSVVPHPQRGDC